MDWKVAGSIDGTHDVSKNDFKVIVFGVNTIQHNGKRQFQPLGMAFGEGEREIVTLVLLLNIKMACKGLFDVIVHRFEGGFNSDRTPVFINVLDYVFPVHSSCNAIVTS
jgi:hypothetical protein